MDKLFLLLLQLVGCFSVFILIINFLNLGRFQLKLEMPSMKKHLPIKGKVLFASLFFMIFSITVFFYFGVSSKKKLLLNEIENDAVKISNYIIMTIEDKIYSGEQIISRYGVEDFNVNSLKTSYENLNIKDLTIEKSSADLDINEIDKVISDFEKKRIIEKTTIFIDKEKLLLILFGSKKNKHQVRLSLDLTNEFEKIKKIFGYEILLKNLLPEKDTELAFFSGTTAKEMVKLFNNYDQSRFFYNDKNNKFLIYKKNFQLKSLTNSNILFAKKIDSGFLFKDKTFVAQSVFAVFLCVFGMYSLLNFQSKTSSIISDLIQEKDFHLNSRNENEKMLDSIVELVNDGIIITDLSGFIKSVNKEANKTSHLAKDFDKNINIKDFFDFSPSPSQRFNKDNFFETIIKNRKLEFEAFAKGKKGKVVKLKIKASIISDHNNNASGFLFSTKELGMKKNESKEAYTAFDALEASQTGFWEWNMTSGEFNFSDSWVKIIGEDVRSLENDIQEIFLRIHPNEKEKVLIDLYNHLNGETDSYYSEYRLRTKNGSYIWVCDKGKMVDTERSMDGSKKIICTTSIIDVKKNEEYFISHKKLLFVKGPIIYFTWRNDEFLSVDTVSRNVQIFMGYKPSDFTSGAITYSDIIDSDGHLYFKEDLSIESKDKETFNNGLISVCTDGGIKKEFFHYINRLKDENGQVSHFIGYVLVNKFRE